MSLPGVFINIAANQMSDQRLIVDAIERQRVQMNKEIDDEIKAEQDHIGVMNGYKTQILTITSQWPPNWFTTVFTGNANRMRQALIDIDNAITDAQNAITNLQNKRIEKNELIDELELRIWSEVVDTGEQDENGDEIYVTYDSNEALEIIV